MIFLSLLHLFLQLSILAFILGNLCFEGLKLFLELLDESFSLRKTECEIYLFLGFVFCDLAQFGIFVSLQLEFEIEYF